VWLTIAAVILFTQVVSADESPALWPSDSLAKVLRTTQPTAGPYVLEFSGARGETVSTQAIFRSNGDVKNATVTITDLKHTSSGATISSKQIKLQWVRYIDLTRNTGGIPADELVAAVPVSIPDTFWEDATISVPANQAQPVWIEVHVSPSASPGDYTGKLSVNNGTGKVTLPIKLHVWDFEVPAERHLSVINWWQFPGAGFKDRVKLYGREYWQLLGKFCAFLVQHRQTDVNTWMGLIDETGDNQRGYKHDTSRLERYAQVAFKAGIRQIHLHSVGKLTSGRNNPGSRVRLVETYVRRLAALDKVIRARNWKGKFAVSICDEPLVHHEETFQQAVERLHKIAPGVRVVEAVETERLGKLDIYVPKLSHLALWYPHFDRVRRQGAQLWFYTCNDPRGRYPNRLLDQSLLKVRVLHWMNYLYDLDGYLHWGLNQFAGGDPYTEDAIGGRWPAGDRVVVYPGKNGLIGSLRFSAMRDGLEDYEYLWVLEDQLRKIKQSTGQDASWLDPRQRPLELCRRVVRTFHDYTRDEKVMLDTRRAIAEEIEALKNSPVPVIQTSPPEGATIPAGSRLIIIRGLATPGARIKIDGQEITNIRKSGYFYHFNYNLPDGHPTIKFEVEHKGKKHTLTRTFMLTD